jgi:hypothetical protein
MKRTLIVSAAVLVGVLGLVSASQAQVFVRAPFVRVYTGDGGVAVRAPFVNLYVPPAGPVVYGPRVIDGPVYVGPRVIYAEPPVAPPMPPAKDFVAPPPQPLPPPPMPSPNGPPPPVQPVQAPTLDSFGKTFQAKAGSYDVTIVNPVTKQPTQVRFMLPEGTPRRVIVTRDSIEFVYSLRQWVRIEFDRDGVMVTSR